MARASKSTPDDDTAGPQGPVREPEPPAASAGGHLCSVAFCPIGMALSAAERVQPDAVSHLLVAGREFFLAAKAVMDARAEDLRGDAPPEEPPRMEHIDIG